MTTKKLDDRSYYKGVVDGINLTMQVSKTFALSDDHPYSDAVDIHDELTIKMKQYIDTYTQAQDGSVAQKVTQRPAKTSTPKGVVGSTPTATANPVILAGKNVVFTGSLRRMTRADAKLRNTRAGVWTQSSVNSKTDYLVVAAASGSVKWNEAVKQGVTVLSEDDWYAATK